LLWREWFIDNQIGRFTGKSTHLGHIKGPFYYGEMLPLALLPWTPALVAWIVHRGWRRWTEGSTGSRNLLRVVAVWSFGSLLFLSLAGTKRNIYLFPLLPAFAVMASVYMEKPALWLKAVLRGITVLLLPGAIYLSFFSPASPAAKFPWGWNLNIFALISALAGIYIFRAARKIILVRLAGITAVVFLVYQFTIMPVIDMKKTYRPMVERLTAAIPEGERGWVLGWDTDERTLGSFAFYGGIYLSEIADPARLASILRGDDESCRLVITRKKYLPPAGADLPDYRVISRGEAEGRDYLLISGSAK
jgi:4-amino-4-deoxy-L-arabinose transferase-like glycosyltransferase